jgi:hypothetical protein
VRFNDSVTEAKRLATQFAGSMLTADPSLFVACDVLVDTNVVLETLSVGDLLREGQRQGARHEDWLGHAWRSDNENYGHQSGEAAWRSVGLQYRLRRARASLLLAWALCERRIPAGMLGSEVLIKLLNLSPAASRQRCSLRVDGTGFAITAGIVNVIRPMLISRGLRLNALTAVEHSASGEDADDELLAIAVRDKLPIITHEGLTDRGLSDRKRNKKLNLRGRCHESGVPVYTAEEYLALLAINTAQAGATFLAACEQPILLAYTQAPQDTPYSDMLEDLVPLFRLILFGETSLGTAQNRASREVMGR